ncbi:predicted protein [Chaetomium globosum CBS 148.51]|uniref:Uncharacterized protein n=1 Tax=Chaetomium globosum (strain ATCC 6205 / CBS 148.51 / DSM 1962 / NBRC 6347 / NRRL 1970) TaxID=306901 RepID=Q2H7M5_CHAGB|nr:uncharacterized protein CHGG_05340 [Chaetomium globosum CBS 148.51]EAQ88721.1 predicted protein [Chaetomium globosum CBS 148.51]
MSCLRGVQGKFEKFKSRHEFRNRWEVALEPKRLEFLLNRGEVLGIAKAIVTFDRLQKACGTGAHGEGGRAGEALCPTQQGQVPCKCPCCGGRHPGWAKECPGRARAKKEAREAYQYRPRVFEPARTAAAEPITAPRSAFTYEKARPQEEEFNKRRKTRGRRPRQGPQSPTPIELAASVVAQWVSYKWKIGWKDRGSNTKEVVELARQARWEQQRASQQSTTRQRVLNRRIADEDPPALLFTDKALMRHEGLTKAQSSLLSQARIGDIGLRDYLFRVKVLEVRTPISSAGEAGRQWSTWWFGAPTRRYKGRGTAERFGHIGTYKPYYGE